ncbi:hypothetical protein BMS87_07720 [Leuconostoc pseudomesenteroides]|nr:hypothetical protein BMS86_07705 [Leuconostoc pseudomesenteroides]ORI54871.1 hypothetical protein BMS87_07720 [Leuconostoc pseudomesenteroides]
MLYMTSLLVSYVGTFFKKNRVLALVSMAILTYISIYANPQINNDYLVYESAYQAAGRNNYFEWLYTLLGQLALKHGLTYLDFRLWLLVFAGAMLAMGLFRLIENPSFVILAYAVTAYFVDTVQVRNYVMLSMMVFAYSFLKKNNIINIVIAVSIGFLATGIHSLGFIFLFGMLFLVLPLKKMIKLFFVGIGGALIVQLLYFVVGPEVIVNIVAKIGGVFVGRANFIDKVTTQYVSVMSFNSIKIIVLSWLYYILGVALIFYEVKLQIDADENKDEYFETKFKLILSVLMVGLIGLSFMNISLDYSRLVRMVFVFELIGLAAFKKKRTSIGYFLFRKLTVIFILVVAFYAQNIVYGQAFIESIPHLINDLVRY